MRSSVKQQRRKPEALVCCTNTTVLTFSQVTWLPSIQWAQKQALASQRVEREKVERIEAAKALQRSQSEPHELRPASRPPSGKLGRRQWPLSGVSQSTTMSATPSQPSVSSASSPERRKRKQPVLKRDLTEEDLQEVQNTIQARVLAGSRRSVRHSVAGKGPVEVTERPQSTAALASRGSIGSRGGRSDAAIYKRHSTIKRAQLNQSLFETIDKRTLRLVFWQFAGEGALIPRNKLKDALLLLGFKDVLDASVDPVVIDTVGRGDKGLKFQEYEDFCEAFDQVYMMGVMKGFREADLDKNGTLDIAEITILLQRQGITVMPGMVKELLEEVGCCMTSGMNMEEYLRLVDIVRLRGGFTKLQTEEFQRLFSRFDYDESGTIDRQEFEAALKWLGFVQDHHEDATVKYLLEGIDREGGEVFEPEFLQAMRRYYEFEITNIQKLFKEQDHEIISLIGVEGVLRIFKAMGFSLATEEHVLESAEEVKTSSRTEFFFEDVVMMVRDIRTREGYLKKNVAAYQEVFDSHDVDGGGQLDVVELGGVLRWLGNPACLEIQLNLMEEVDVDKSGCLEFNEFLKAMRRFQEQELDTLDALFRKADTDNSGHLSWNELKRLYRILGFDLTSGEMKKLKEKYRDREASFEESWEEISILREHQRKRMHETAGFNNKALKKLENYFNKNSHTGRTDGMMKRDGLLNKVNQLLPSQANDEFIDKFISKYGDESGRLGWKEFLACVRLVQDRHDWHQLEQEEIVSKELGFTREQVIEFRRLFQAVDTDGSQQIDFEELQALFEQVMPMTMRARRNLQKALNEKNTDMSEGLDFVEFMQLLHDVETKGLGESSEEGEGEEWCNNDEEEQSGSEVAET